MEAPGGGAQVGGKGGGGKWPEENEDEEQEEIEEKRRLRDTLEDGKTEEESGSQRETVDKKQIKLG